MSHRLQPMIKLFFVEILNNYIGFLKIMLRIK